MRCALILSLMAGALLGQDVPMPEETAAMLLAADPEEREVARGLLERDLGRRYEREVLGVVSRWAADRAGWMEDLEKRARSAGGTELKRVQAMLGHLAGAKGKNIETRLAFVSVPPVLARQLLGAGSPTVVYPQPQAWDVWWRALRADAAVEVIFERTIPTRDTRPASFAHGSKVSYVSGYEHDEKRAIISPVVKTIENGVRMEWTPHLSKDGRFVTLECELKLSYLKRPIETADLTLAGQTVRYEKPSIQTTTMRQVVTIPAGGHCAWRLPDPTAKPDAHVIVVLTSVHVAG